MQSVNRNAALMPRFTWLGIVAVAAGLLLTACIPASLSPPTPTTAPDLQIFPTPTVAVEARSALPTRVIGQTAGIAPQSTVAPPTTGPYPAPAAPQPDQAAPTAETTLVANFAPIPAPPTALPTPAQTNISAAVATEAPPSETPTSRPAATATVVGPSVDTPTPRPPTRTVSPTLTPPVTPSPAGGYPAVAATPQPPARPSPVGGYPGGVVNGAIAPASEPFATAYPSPAR